MQNLQFKAIREAIVMERRRVVIHVSDPYEFYSENADGTFHADIVGADAGHWIVRFAETPIYEGLNWEYALLLTRHTGQAYFDDPQESDRASNIVLLKSAAIGFGDGVASLLESPTGCPHLIGEVSAAN